MEPIKSDEAYRMDRPLLGHAYIVNNLATEMPETVEDTEELRKVYEGMGFVVHVKSDCDLDEMKQISSEMMSEELHAKSNCFMLTIMTHGDQFGLLCTAKKYGCLDAWQIDVIKGLDQFVEMGKTDKIAEGLNSVSTLVGKPKLLIVDACRGSKMTTGKPVSARFKQPQSEPKVVADMADFYIAYATVPNYASAGSHFAQSVAKNLRDHHLEYSIDRIFTCVRRDMETITMTVRGEGSGIRMAPENRTSLRRELMFSKFDKNKKRGTPEEERLKFELERQKEESAKQQREMMEQMREMKEMMQKMQTGGQPSGAAPVDNERKPAQGPDRGNQNIQRKLTDKHILNVANAIDDEDKLRKLAAELDQIQKLQTNLTNNPKDITGAAYKLLTGWKVSKENEYVQWEKLYEALGVAQLGGLKKILEQ